MAKNYKLLALTSFLFAASCAYAPKSTPKKIEGTQLEVSVPEDAAEDSSKNDIPLASELKELRGLKKLKVGVVVGPGGALSSSSLGFLKALIEANIEIAALSGVGWGSLFTATYAQEKSLNSVEWDLYKLFKQELFSRKLLSIGGSQFSLNKIKNFYKQVFKSKRIESFKVKYSCAAQSTQTSVHYIVEKGVAKSALLKCLLYPPFYGGEQRLVAAPLSVASLVKWQDKQNLSLIIALNPLANRKFIRDKKFAKLSLEEKLLWKEIYSFYSDPYLNLQQDVHTPVRWVGLDLGQASILSFKQWKTYFSSGYNAGVKFIKDQNL